MSQLNSLNVGIKKLNKKAIIPTYAKIGDAGLDLTAIDIKANPKYIEYDTGLSFEIPEGYVGLLFPRSSISNYNLSLANSVGVIDSGYRGPVKLRFKTTSDDYTPATKYEIGDKVGQLVIMPIPTINLIEKDELSNTDRGLGGFGSTTK